MTRAAELSPDVVLIDQAMADSQDATRWLLAVSPASEIVALGVPDTERDVIASAEAGVSSYVTREASLDDLVAAVESVGRGELRCSPRAAGSLFRRVARQANGAGPSLASRLTVREAQIVPLIEQGFSNKEIGCRLGIEVATVKNHIHNLLEKLQVHRRAEAAAKLRHHPPGGTLVSAGREA